MRRSCGAILAAAIAAGLPSVGAAARNVEPSKVDSRYFADSEGRTFVPVGCNICFARVYDPSSPGSRAKCEELLFGWLRKFAANGGNYVRIWLTGSSR